MPTFSLEEDRNMCGKRRIVSAVLLAIATAATLTGLSLYGDHGGGLTGPAAGRFVVHEWGTFTSFSGSDGVKLEFRPLLDADLPPFVLNRPRQAGAFNPFSKSAYPVLARMETPVTYFYTDRPREVNVRVGFPRGLLTEFFPPVASMKPEFTGAAAPIGDSELDWGRVWVLPDDAIRVDLENREVAKRMRERMLPRLPPLGDAYDHYALARQTDSAMVYVEREADPNLPYAPHGGWFEKFLFYRGVGNFELPLRLTAQAGGRFELANTGSQPIRSLFLVSVEEQHVRFAAYDEIGAGDRLTMVQSTQSATIDDLADAVQKALVREGLYEKEATAMVNTWRSSWFGEQGTRLFYLLPERLTDELLPLSIEPAPEERLRVMVGRMEIMSPEDESRLTEAVRKNAEDRAAAVKANAAAPQGLPEAITRMGRLAEPGLVRVRNIASDPAVRSEAAFLLEQLRPQAPQPWQRFLVPGC
jgi:hypothetical protein